MLLTDKKYALSPVFSGSSSFVYFAYGGPHARVSSPLVGCSTLMTSALIQLSQLAPPEPWLLWPKTCILLNLMPPTQGLLISVCSRAGRLSEKENMFTVSTYSSQNSCQIQNADTSQRQSWGVCRCRRKAAESEVYGQSHIPDSPENLKA